MPNQKVLLTLHIPQGARGVPVTSSADPELLHHFKVNVLREWALKVRCAPDEIIAITYRAEYDRLEKLLNLLIPDPEASHA